ISEKKDLRPAPLRLGDPRVREQLLSRYRSAGAVFIGAGQKAVRRSAPHEMERIFDQSGEQIANGRFAEPAQCSCRRSSNVAIRAPDGALEQRQCERVPCLTE